MRILSKVLAIIFTILVSQVAAQESRLDLKRIFTDYEFSSDYFGPSRWVDDGEGYTTVEKSADVAGGQDIIRYETATQKREVLVSAASLIPAGKEKPLQISNYSWSDDKTKLLIFTNTARVWRYNTKGDYWVLDVASRKLHQLGGADAKPSTLMFAKFSPQGDRVAYVREHNVFVEDLTTKRITQLTFDGSTDLINGTFDWAYEEEFDARDGFLWSPDGKAIAFWQLDASGIKDFLMINNTDSVYSYTIPVQYPKVGEDNSACRVGVVRVSGGDIQWMNVPGDPKNNFIPRMIWVKDSQHVLLQHLNRKQNTNQLMKCNAATGHVETIFTEKDEAWLDTVDDWQWLDDKGSKLLWVSERRGWRQVYTLSSDGKDLKLITPSPFDVISIEEVDTRGGWLYYIASPENATQRYLYRSKLSGKGKPERLSPAHQPGTHSYYIAPGAKYALHHYSTAEVPNTTSLISLPDHKTMKVMVSNDKLKQKIAALDKNPMEFFQVDIGEGVMLDAYMIKPAGFDPSKKYPVLFYVYGEPWNQTVLDQWGGSTYLWHQYLAQNGYIVMSVDNRGTPAPKGRNWRKAVYGQIGILASADQSNAVKGIIKKYSFVDKERIGIWGWSGGGSMTLNAMFRYPEIYHTGMSVAPVANQLLYDNIYQERYMGLSSENAEGYKNGSPITFAKNLKGNLLLIHGTGDDNVHYQNSELLINELVKHNKMFTFMAYPNRSHGIYEGENTSRHLREYLTWYLKNNLPAGPR
ncbi:Dipeptidyl peptidase IV [Fulvivirga imtechensis AK7]|uniref:Dipeptidyl peptidase IV n=1 Tax=Fulvivirga imtechensis AK7 TaxID=1237149 RepID=L8JNN5_9BACT|nr:S9 family peptidase [Fulvivirga imtechensis]ELR68992.1 Dipeptidyl peptidase IV [Fulvivirga imtechensis AK7]